MPLFRSDSATCRRRASLALACAAAITLLATAPLRAQAEPPDDGTPTGPALPFKEAVKKYRAYLKRKSLMKRVEGRMLLAHTRDPRALDVLTASYARTEDPKDQVRYLLVGIILRYFDQADHGVAFAQWRKKNEKPRDAWLWFRTLGLKFMTEQMNVVLDIVSNHPDTWLRAAAIEAVSVALEGGGEEQSVIADHVAGVLQNLPDKPVERSILVESCAALVLAHRKAVLDPDKNKKWKPICATLIGALDDHLLHPRSKLVLSRHFAALFDVPNLGFAPRLWLNKLEQGPTPDRTEADGTKAAFFGVRSLGTRICYVIDASDSMLKRITSAEKKRLASLTGPRKPAAGSATAPESQLPWDKIKTRFDVAREYLKLSIAGLNQAQHFVVIMFGDAAEPLAATPKLVAANKTNVRRAIAELDGIKGLASDNPQRPDGILRGRTNMHAGLLEAFCITKSRYIKREEYVSSKALTDGCDTIYLLSDGEPSWDSYGALDKRDPEDGVADPESGKKFESQQRMGFYWGPYGRQPHGHMLEDFRRLNLFRKVQIHCVGIGEADQKILEGIARSALGRVVKITEPGQK